MDNKSGRQLALWVLALVFIYFLVHAFQKFSTEEPVAYSEFKRLLSDKRIENVVVRNDLIRGYYKDNEGKLKAFRTIPLPDPKLVEAMQEAEVKSFEGEPERSWLTAILINFGWIIFFFGVWWFIMTRQMQMGGRQALSFGRSKAKLANANKKQKITFVDVAGCDEAKEELIEIVEFLKNPQKFQRLGGKIPKGVMLYGAPGTGKTLLAKAVAGEAGVPFYTSSGSEFVEMFVGVGAARVRDLFEQARKTAPAVIFVDELDAVGRYRFAGIGGGHDEREQTLNQLLVELDGFDTKEGLVLIAATNRPDVIDPALLRPGRFDRHVNIPAPDLKGREDILKVHAKTVKFNADVDFKVIAQRSPGFVGSDLANVINEAALLAARRDKQAVEMTELEEAIERVLAGPQRKSRLISDKEKKVIAYHEAGHTLVAKSLPGADPVHKVSIIPRGPALGYTLQLPSEDRYLTTKTELLNRLAVLLGGRCAEELIFGEVTTGAQDDLMKATSFAQRMVTEFGMSENLGPVTYRKQNEEVFLGRDLVRSHQYSDQTAEKIDAEVRGLIEQARSRARKILELGRVALDTLASKLIEKEALDGREVEDLIRSVAPQLLPQTA
ncbi:MAG: ATP-dependent metallopeptidase FtsH/Yme1/Tma family protein [Elusimicrobia bacterium]|nr:ATP-dependent metallopeptidase FtsH/Yme1/Tma family protein [Elusimicrobiota bacterium]